MDRQSLSKEEREERASRELADRLDSLSRPLAERVLGRAIELQAVAEEEALEEAGKITYDDLKKIALEVGIPEDALRKALLEELDTEKDHGAKPVEKVTGPNHVRGGVVVGLDEAEIQRRLRRYFEQGQGLEYAGRGGQWTWWRRGGPYGDRVIESLVTAQRESQRKLVELDVNTTEERRKAIRIAIGIGLLIFLFGGPFGLAFVFLAGLALFTAGAAFIGVVRSFIRRARRGVNHALESLVGATQTGTDWIDVIEGALKEMRKE